MTGLDGQVTTEWRKSKKTLGEESFCSISFFNAESLLEVFFVVVTARRLSRKLFKVEKYGENQFSWHSNTWNAIFSYSSWPEPFFLAILSMISLTRFFLRLP